MLVCSPPANSGPFLLVSDLERRIGELRYVKGVEKAEHVPFPSDDQLWVRFNQPLDLGQLGGLVRKQGCVMVRFGKIPSKLPRGLSEMLWDGVTHVVASRISGWSKFLSSLGFEPEGIAKIATDLHGPYQIFIATAEEGVQLLYAYLGLAYTPPAPPKPTIAAKPPAPAAPRPASPAAPTPPRPELSNPSQQAEPLQPTVATASEPAGQPRDKEEAS